MDCRSEAWKRGSRGVLLSSCRWLVRPGGGFGLIATNTLAQGDTREVGLDQLVEWGYALQRAVASKPWPGGASLAMATVWGTRRIWTGSLRLTGSRSGGITPGLSDRGRVEGNSSETCRLPRPIVHRLVRARAWLRSRPERSRGTTRGRSAQRGGRPAVPVRRRSERSPRRHRPDSLLTFATGPKSGQASTSAVRSCCAAGSPGTGEQYPTGAPYSLVAVRRTVAGPLPRPREPRDLRDHDSAQQCSPAVVCASEQRLHTRHGDLRHQS